MSWNARLDVSLYFWFLLSVMIPLITEQYTLSLGGEIYLCCTRNVWLKETQEIKPQNLKREVYMYFL